MKRAGYSLLLFLLPFFVLSQKYGTPLLRYYAPAEYKGFAQNWCIAQDDRGVMYFGNGKGILEYNGKTWRRFPTEQRTTVLCMAKDKAGRVYIGAEGEIGYLAPDSLGEMRFVSLNKFISEKENKFSYVWAAHATNEGICFVAGEKILCWNGTSMKYYTPEKGFFTSFCVNGTLYVVSTDVGLMALKNGKLELLPGTETIYEASVRYIGAMGDKIFITSRKGFFSYDTQAGLQKITSEVESFLNEKGLYKGVTLPDGNYALGTMGGGVLIVNCKGEVLETIDESKGLEGKSVYALYVDRENELWLAQENGISRVSYSTPIRISDTRHGLHGIIRTITETSEGLFAATFQGLFKLNANGTFSVQNKITTGANVTVPYTQNSLLLCAGEIGTIQVKGDKNIFIHSDPYVLSMQVYKQDSSFVIAGSVDKAYVFKNDKGNWSTLTTIDSLGDEINTLAQVKNTFWLTTTNKGVMYSLDFDASFTKYQLKKYDSAQGLPAGLLEAYAYEDKLYVGSDKGVLGFDEQQGKFLADTKYWNVQAFDPPSYAYLLKIDQKGRPWVLSNMGFGYFEKDHFFNSPFRRIGFSDYYALHTENDGSAWLGGTNGIALYTPGNSKDYNKAYHALLSRVIHGKDTLFKGSYFTASGVPGTEQNEKFKYPFAYKGNSLLFEYASPFFDNEAALTFSYKLEGFENEWSDWVTETRKEYTNLAEGTYVFQVKAKNIYEVESSEASFEFTVLAPWYRTWWAYFLYVIGSGLLVFALIKIQTARLRRENEKLEKIVQERTAEIVQKNEKLKVAYDEIEEKQKEILDSIHYAKRIQRSLLPTEFAIEKALKKLKGK